MRKTLPNFCVVNKISSCGHLLQDRYKSEPVEDNQYFLAAVRYIHQNPLKAGLHKNIADYKWSSYGEYIGAQKIIDAHFALSLFSDYKEMAIKLGTDEKIKLKDDGAKEKI